MATGTVRSFSDEKGFGFITPDERGRDLFVHFLSIAGTGSGSIAEGTKVSYDAKRGAHGPAAFNVQTILGPTIRYR
jgi:cold shock protein